MRDSDGYNTLDVLEWLEADRAQPMAERLHRDRKIGRACAEHKSRKPLSLVQMWWHHVQDGDRAPSRGAQMQGLRATIGLIVGVVGFLSGLGLIVAVFQYDGSHPINVVTILAVFVVLQAFMILLSLLMVLPGHNAISALLFSLNPAAMLSQVMRRKFKQLFPSWHNPGSSHTLADQNLSRWQMFAFSQLMGATFNAGALIGGVLLIVFTDLAFGWSSTLKLETGEFQYLVQLVSIPWAWFWPEAVPTQALIEQSRFFRLGTVQSFVNNAQYLTNWWPFVLACIGVYGFFPRLVLLIFTQAMLRRFAAKQLLEDPRVIALLDRMNTPEVALHDAHHASNSHALDDRPYTHASLPGGYVPVVVWAEAAPLEELLDFLSGDSGVRISDTFDAGGLCTLAQDTSSLDSLGGLNASAVLIVVKAWEPPLNELLDYVIQLRQRLQPDAAIIMLPIGAGLLTAETDHLKIWRHAIAQLADEHIYVEARLGALSK